MNGTPVREYDALYTAKFSKIVIGLRTGTTTELNPGDRVHIVVNEYGNAYIDDQYVGDESDFTKEAT
jgi:hypothetical protein